MKIGVATVPWGKINLPQRAELRGSVARRENDTVGALEIGRNHKTAKLNRDSGRLLRKFFSAVGHF